MAKSIKIRSFELLQNWGLSILVLGWFIFVLAPFGPAVTFDSVSFLQAADNFYTTGHYVHSGPTGLEFAAHRFPVYPLLLSAFSFSKAGTFIFQVLLFSGTLVFLKKLISTIKAPPFLIIGLAFTGVIINYYCLWTEGLFGLLFMGLVYQLRLFESSKQVKWLLILISLLCLTRLVGLVVGGSLFLALISTKEYKTGRNVLITTIVVVGLWVTLGTLLLGSTAREFTFHLLTLNDFLDSFKSLAELFIPFEIRGSVKMIFGFLLFLWPVGS